MPARVLTTVVASLILAVTGLMIAISLAALVFSGALAGYLSAGIGYFLFGALVIGLVSAIASTFPNTAALPQDTPSVIMGLIAVAIVGQMQGVADPAQIFYTVVATMALISLLLGLLFFLLGTFKLGSLIRYVPYPVIGGFLAGTGWLLVEGAMGVLVGDAVTFRSLFSLFQPELLPRWIPGLMLAVVLLLILRRSSHPLVLPGILVGAIALFYLVLFVQGIPVAAASAQGWLLGPFPDGGLWYPLTLSGLQLVDWGAVLAQSATIGTLLLICLFSFLLNASGVELAARQDMNLNRELQVTGLANGLSGLGGGPVGYHALSLTVLSHRMSPDNRFVGVMIALLYGLTLVTGASFLSYFPNFLLGGLLLFIGLDFLATWVYDIWYKVSKAEYGIVLLILFVIGLIGVLEGVALGILLAMALFVIDYSRISAVKHTLSGASYRSKVDRPGSHRLILRQQGDLLYILELQGYLFFGTANGVLERVRQRLNNQALPSPRFVLLDFRQVHSLDASATLSMSKLKQLAQSYGFILILTHLSPGLERQLTPELLTRAHRDLWHTFPDLDHALEWCEEQILAESQDETIEGMSADGEPDPFSRLLGLLTAKNGEREENSPAERTVGMNYVEQLGVAAGDFLIRQGDPPKGLYFLETGQMTAQLTLDNGHAIRLRTMHPGTTIGELGVYAKTAASASVVALESSTLYFLSLEHLEDMERDDPEMAAVVHRYIARLVSERLMDATDSIRALLA